MNDYGKSAGQLAVTGTSATIGGVYFGWWALLVLVIGVAAVLATSTRFGFRRRRGVTSR